MMRRKIRRPLARPALQYNPHKAPNPTVWLASDETERIEEVHEYHRRKRIELPNARLHAVAHVIVENQIALGDDPPVRSTLLRLMAGDLDRHDAIHAIASVLMVSLRDLQNEAIQGDPNDRYTRHLEALTVQGWLSLAE